MSKSKTIGVIGTRRRNSTKDLIIVEDAFLEFYETGDIICSGLCPEGGDRFAVMIQEKYNIPKIWHPAEWEKYGKAAGFIRNSYIARDSDILIACVSEDRKGGTEDTIKKYRKLGKTQYYIV